MCLDKEDEMKGILVILVAVWLLVGNINFWYGHWWHADSLDYIAGLVCLVGIFTITLCREK